MSVPYGAPQQQPPGPAPQQPSAAAGANNINLGLILPLVAAGLGLVAYLLAFADDVSSGDALWLMVAGALAGLTLLPNAPKFIPVAAALSGVQMLLVLQGIIKAPSVEGMQIVLLIVALLQTAAIVLTLLLAEGIVKFEPKPANPYGGQQHGQPGGWNPQSGAFPQQGQHQQPAQHGAPQQAPQPQFGQQFGQPQQPQQPQQPGQPPQQTSFMPQPGQFGSPGTPPGGFGGPQQ